MKLRHITLVSLFVASLLNPGIVKAQSTGNVCGIGAVVAPDAPDGTPTLKAVIADHINVIKVNSGSPGEISGLQKGDDIIEINGASVVGMNFYDVVTKLIRGNEGTSITITVRRKGSASPLSLTMVREPVRVEP
jgi:C-terminal processing protease CtpA/Prc